MYYERESRAIDREKLWNCYLPAGTKWYDFHTLKEYEGGTEVEADASLDHIPVFVKAGAVIPMEQRMRYADEVWIHPLRSIFIRALTEALFCMRMMETDMHMSRVNITRFLLPGRMMSAA